MTENRREATTEHLRNVAISSILSNGVKTFSLNAVANDAFVSIGAVYERWENKSDALVDLAEHVVARDLTSLLDRIAPLEFPRQMQLLFTDAEALQAQQLLVELLFAAKDDPELRPITTALTGRYIAALQSLLGEGELAEALGNWTASTLLGSALLHLGGASLPDLSAEVTHALNRATGYERGGILSPVGHEIPGITPNVPSTSPRDPTGERLLDAAKTHLSTADIASTRDVASTAGVTTGALYRRFGSKSELINEVLIAELQPDRYAWASQLISTWRDAASTDDVADVISEQFIAALAHTAQVNMLLQITAQARADAQVRLMLVGQVENVARTREAMFAAIQQAGVLASFATPPGQAWLLQATPTGARLLAANGLGLSPDHIVLAIRAIAAALIAPPSN